MIQRIQSLYLLVALVITSVLFSMDLAKLANETGLFRLTVDGVYSIDSEVRLVMPAYALTSLLIADVALLLIIIFLFRKRILQIRLAAMGMVLLAGLSGMIYYFGKTASKELGAELSFTWAIVLPLVSMVLVFMAIKAIGRDEALIRSIDRIR